MINFGFTLSPSSRIDLDKANKPDFSRLAEIEPDILKCMACGSCAASCSTVNFGKMNLRKVILMLTRGEEKDALPLLETCVLCGKCTMVCPRGINTRHLIISISEAYKEAQKTERK